MSSVNQLKANRANARRSTGPNTVSGKARSSMNACKHGLTAQTVVIGDEDPAQFDCLRKVLEQDFDPHSMIERELVERLAGIVWRLRRMPKFEAALVEARREEARKWEQVHEIGAITGLALIRDSRQQDALGKLSRHEVQR
jgi:hypothetical protein